MENLIQVIEQLTDFDVLNNSEHSIDVINRFDSDGEVTTVEIYNLSEEQIINSVNSI